MAKTDLFLCMGSACHQEGAFWVRQALDALIASHGLQDTVELKGSLCLGPCKDRIVIRVGDQLVLRVNPDNVEQKFRDEIMPLLAREAQR